MATVSLLQVSKHVGAATILKDVTLSIKKGEFMVVVGPSGCGKSSLLRLIAGLDTVSSGRILINEQCVNNVPASLRDMAMVFQSYALYPHMTVYDNMAYGLKMRRFSKPEINQRVTQAADLLQLRPYLDRKPKALSGGQRQRVAMGRAIVRSPSVFLFDEPLSNLDAKLRNEMRHEIKKLHQKLRTTSLYVTHDQTEAMTMAERVLILNQGCIEQIGSPQELYQTPSSLFVAGFTGHFPMNFLSAVYDKSTHSILTECGACLPMPDSVNPKSVPHELIIAIRPEHILCVKELSQQTIELNVEFVDDMGADKLVQASTIQNGLSITVRVPTETTFQDNRLLVELPLNKVHFFDKNTKRRIGE